MVFVSHPSKAAIERYVMDDAALRASLREKGKEDLAAALCPRADDAIFTMQDEPLGLGHAVLCARDHVLPGPVAVNLARRPDPRHALPARDGGGLRRRRRGAHGGDHDRCRAARCRNTASSTGPRRRAASRGRAAWSRNPRLEAAPSREVGGGALTVLDPSIFDALATQTPGAGGEIQLTDAIARRRGPARLAGFRFGGVRFDCGSKAGMLRGHACTLRRQGPPIMPRCWPSSAPPAPRAA